MRRRPPDLRRAVFVHAKSNCTEARLTRAPHAAVSLAPAHIARPKSSRRPLALLPETYLKGTPADPGRGLCFGCVSVLTYSSTLRDAEEWSKDHSGTRQNCGRNRALRAGD